MLINRWLLSSLFVFVVIETLGVLFRHHSAMLPIAAYTLISTFAFFGLFFTSYIISAFYAEVNSWVSQVDRMDWGLNPMYTTWLFATDRRRWALYTTILSALASAFAGAFIFNIFAYKWVDLNTSLIGFCVSSGFLTLLAFSWYYGFWKPRTREMESEEFCEEAESEEKYYFPAKPA